MNYYKYTKRFKKKSWAHVDMLFYTKSFFKVFLFIFYDFMLFDISLD